jgi:hypothetical protein
MIAGKILNVLFQRGLTLMQCFSIITLKFDDLNRTRGFRSKFDGLRGIKTKDTGLLDF